MRLVSIVSIFLLLVFKANALGDKLQTDIVFENKVIILDSVIQGTLVKAVYHFKNIGRNNLIVEYVNPDCICTGYSLSDSIIAPDESGMVELKFDTKKDLGMKKLVAVMKANTDCKFYKLILKVNILEKKDQTSMSK